MTLFFPSPEHFTFTRFCHPSVAKLYCFPSPEHFTFLRYEVLSPERRSLIVRIDSIMNILHLKNVRIQILAISINKGFEILYPVKFWSLQTQFFIKFLGKFYGYNFTPSDVEIKTFRPGINSRDKHEIPLKTFSLNTQ